MRVGNVQIAEQWQMSIPEGVGGTFGEWVFRSPKDSTRRIAASYMVYEDLAALNPHIETAHEYFGGVGAQSLMIEHFFAPQRHTIWDRSPEAVEHLKRVMPYADVSLVEDSFVLHEPADLVALDEVFTVWKTRHGQPFRELMDEVFKSQPVAVELTENAATRLHLHRERYDQLLGSGASATYETYLEALEGYLEYEFGYGIATGYYYHGGAKMILMPAEEVVLPGGFKPLPENHIQGVEVLSVTDTEAFI